MGVGKLLMDPLLIDLRGDPGRQRREKLVRRTFLAAAVFSVAISVAIVVSLFGEAGSFRVVSALRLILRTFSDLHCRQNSWANRHPGCE